MTVSLYLLGGNGIRFGCWLAARNRGKVSVPKIERFVIRSAVSLQWGP